jgi:trimethylamine--corrinoid protein Co-methyltransferase
VRHDLRLKRPEILSRDELDTIYLSAVYLLKKVGVQIQHDETVNLLKDNGCDVGKHNIVHFPEHLVKECLQLAPSQITLCGRDPKRDMKLGRGTHTYTGVTFMNHIMEYPDRKYRISTMKDCMDIYRLADYYESIDFTHNCQGAMEYGKWNAYAGYEAGVSYSTKHCHISTPIPDVIDPICELASAMVGGKEELRKRPIVSAQYCAISPLTWNREGCETLKKEAEWGIPTYIVAEDMMGATAPVSLAGNLAQKIAEFLSGNVLMQLMDREHPVIFFAADEGFDFRTSQCAFSTINNHVLKWAIGQIGRYLDVPVKSCTTSDAHVLDAQWAFEHSFGFLSGMMSGVDELVGGIAGGAGLTTCLEAYPLFDESIITARRILEGIDVNAETLALDLIEEICAKIENGLRAGYFIDQRHTLKWMNIEQRPRRDMVFNKDKLDMWEKMGSKDYYQRAHQEVKKILREHEVTPLPEDAKKKIFEIRKQYEIKPEERSTTGNMPADNSSI